MGFAAAHLTLDQLGVYGVFNVAISYSVAIVGFDFIYYTTRELLAEPKSNWASILLHHLVLVAVTFSAISPLLLLIFACQVLDWSLIGWFYLILVLEQPSQDLYRLLVGIGRSVKANIVLFVRCGIWPSFIILGSLRMPSLLTLENVWISWSLCSVASIGLGILFVRDLEWGKLRRSLDFAWMKKGISSAFKILIGGLATRTMNTFDRFFVSSVRGESEVGIYSFYSSIAAALMAFVDAGVISRNYSSLISACRKNQYKLAQSILVKTLTSTAIVALLFILGGVLCIDIVLNLIGKEELAASVGWLWCMLAAATITAFANVMQCALIGLGKETVIQRSSLIISVLFFILILPVLKLWGVPGLLLLVVSLQSLSLLMRGMPVLDLLRGSSASRCLD